MSIGTTGAIIAGAVIAGGATVAGSEISAGAQADAAAKQMTAQEYAVYREQQMRQHTQELALSESRMSPGELAAIGSMINDRQSALNASLGQIKQQMEALNAVDPAVKAAGQQTLQLLNGQSSKYLAPVMAQREQQRAKLENQLAAQMGPGFRTSTAGIQAMTQFDMATDSLTAQVQQQALQEVAGTFSSLFGQEQQGLQAGTSAIDTAYSRAGVADSAVQQAYSYASTRNTNAVLGATTASPINFGGPASVAGNGAAAGITMGNALGNLGSGVGGGIGTIAGMNYQQEQQNNFFNRMGYGGGASTGSNFGSAIGAVNTNPSYSFGSSIGTPGGFGSSFVNTEVA